MLEFDSGRKVKEEMELIESAVDSAIKGEPFSLDESKPKTGTRPSHNAYIDSSSSAISKQTYVKAYKRILWRLRQLAYVKLRMRIRENAGKLRDQDRDEVGQLLVTESASIREKVFAQLEIGVPQCEDSFTALQRCYFQNNSDPEFANKVNEARNDHVLMLRGILQGELLPELEQTDPEKITDAELDAQNQSIIRKVGVKA